ncbi:MAG: RNA methyltransferase RsmD family [Candidatus Saganbacteria bacterium]|uniref:RNA methyltransferase RsmD family n=1 Tax=Candidatus Saganbacteria bacterium TaxID=2575572 RepID=A0A833L2Q8_UNCSA|nr:MAG: RNA methyltransferase RsmD family [Candidatus Saganbacteria bacterium]
MRVISGKAKGRQLKVPKGNIRPLTSQAKEALFNIFAAKTPECDFLDLFAGSGAVGIEALSRGARIAFFVEIDRKSIPVIWENLKLCGFADNAEVYSLPVNRALIIFNKKGVKFDIIFAGAPYGFKGLEETLIYLGEYSLLKDSGVIIAEHRHKQDLAEEFGKLKKIRSERYGDTVFSFYKEQ